MIRFLSFCLIASMALIPFCGEQSQVQAESVKLSFPTPIPGINCDPREEIEVACGLPESSTAAPLPKELRGPAPIRPLTMREEYTNALWVESSDVWLYKQTHYTKRCYMTTSRWMCDDPDCEICSRKVYIWNDDAHQIALQVPVPPAIPPCKCGCMEGNGCQCQNCAKRTADPTSPDFVKPGAVAPAAPVVAPKQYQWVQVCQNGQCRMVQVEVQAPQGPLSTPGAPTIPPNFVAPSQMPGSCAQSGQSSPRPVRRILGAILRPFRGCQ